MRTHARWLVDSSWTEYRFDQQDTSTEGVFINRVTTDTQNDGVYTTVDLFSEETNITVNTTEAKLEYPRFMETGYADRTKPVAGKATLGLKDQPGSQDLTPLVGTHVIMNVSAFIDSSTSFNPNATNLFQIDVGKMIVGAVWLAGPTLISSTYTRRVSGIISGVLASAVSGYWTISLGWEFRHLNAINDQYDNFILHFDVNIFGYNGVRGLFVLDY